MPTVTIIGINYAPEPTGIALNTVGLAEGLARLGWQVRVVTGIPHYPAWKATPAPRSETVNGVDIIRRPHYIPKRMNALTRGWYEATWFFSAIPWASGLKRTSVVLGVTPSVGGGLLAALAAARCRVPMCLLVQDLVGKAAAASGMPGGKYVSGLVDRIETLVARRASHLFVVADAFRSHFVERGVASSRITRVRNPSRLPAATEPRERTRERLGWEPGEFMVVHTGAIGFKQGLETALDAVHMLERERVRLVLVGEGSRKEALLHHARVSGMTNLTVMPLVPKHDYGNLLRAADVLLLNQSPNVRNSSLPAKLAQYFASGVSVLAAVAAEDEVAQEVRRAEAGRVVNAGDANTMAQALLELKRNDDERAMYGEAGASFARDFLSTTTTVEAADRVLRGLLEA